MEDTSIPSRRRFLQTTSVGAALGLAGCLGRLGFGGMDPGDFPYAAGFSASDIDLELALGRDSAMASVGSLRLTSERNMLTTFGDLETTIDGAFDADAETFQVSQKRLDTISVQFIFEGAYFDSEELFERVKVEPRSLDFSYRARPHEFDPETDYRLLELRDMLDDIDLTATEVRQPNELPLAVYTAEPENFGAGSLFQEWADALGEVSEGSVELQVDERGLIHAVDARVAFGERPEEGIEIEASWRYSGFGETTVDPPEWFDEVPAREPPEVDVAFDETEGEYLRVTIGSMENTDEVAIVLEGEGVVAHFEEPGEHLLEVSDYTTEEGQAQGVVVFAENAIRGPVQVGFYQPRPPE